MKMLSNLQQIKAHLKSLKTRNIVWISFIVVFIIASKLMNYFYPDPIVSKLGGVLEILGTMIGVFLLMVNPSTSDERMADLDMKIAVLDHEKTKT